MPHRGRVAATAGTTLSALLLLSVIALSDARGTRTQLSAEPGRSKYRNVFVQSGVGSGPRIIGGFDAAPGQFPYQVSVRSTAKANFEGHFCGGSILNATTVLTAAHCLYHVGGTDIGQLYIVAGSNLLKEGGVKIFVKEKLVHPDYGPVYNDYDIALLFLEEPLPTDNAYIRPVPLQDVENLPSGYACTATGWGTTVEGKNILPNKLQGVDVPIIDFDRCATYYSEEQDYAPIIETQICAGFEEGMKDACQGDSGGPLVCHGKLTGIVSWGAGCGWARLPGVYTDVAFMLDWIGDVGSNADFDNGTSTTTKAADNDTGAAAVASSGTWILGACLAAAMLAKLA